MYIYAEYIWFILGQKGQLLNRINFKGNIKVFNITVPNKLSRVIKQKTPRVVRRNRNIFNMTDLAIPL